MNNEERAAHYIDKVLSDNDELKIMSGVNQNVTKKAKRNINNYNGGYIGNVLLGILMGITVISGIILCVMLSK